MAQNGGFLFWQMAIKILNLSSLIPIQNFPIYGTCMFNVHVHVPHCIFYVSKFGTD